MIADRINIAAAGGAAPLSYPYEVVVPNGDFSGPFDTWWEGGSSYFYATTSGGYLRWGGSATGTNQVYASIMPWLPDELLPDVEAGLLTAELTWDQSGYNNDSRNRRGWAKLHAYDGNNSLLTTSTSGVGSPTSWTSYSLLRALPAGTRRVRIDFWAEKTTITNASIDALFDNARLFIRSS